MLQDFLQDQAALYATGAMPAQEREQFEILLQFHGELRALVTGLLETSAAVTLASQADEQAPEQLKRRILDSIVDRPQSTTAEAVVVSGPDGLVQWVSPAFTEMCGYTVEELRGKKLGPILQGAETDRETANRMRDAVKEYRSCRETILNYHKDGSPYWVEIAINPVFNDAGEPLWLVARERELTNRVAA